MEIIDFEEFKKLSTKEKIKYVENNTTGFNTPMWFNRIEDAWEKRSPLTVSAWDFLLDIYWEMYNYKT